MLKRFACQALANVGVMNVPSEIPVCCSQIWDDYYLALLSFPCLSKLLMRSHNPYPQKSTFYRLFLPNVTIPTPSAPTQCLSYISPQTPLHICHPLQLQDKVLVRGLYYSEPHYYSKLSEHRVFHCTVHIISSDFYLY